MRFRFKIAAALLPLALAACQKSVAVPQPVPQAQAAVLQTAPSPLADVAHPEVVELFQSQGCSSCPPANRLVMPLADRPDKLVLSWQVTYWDHLGWKDKFADPAYTERQWRYARALKHDQVFTPQVVVNGRGDVIGSNPAELNDALNKYQRGKGGPAIVLSAGKATVTGATPGVQVELVRYDPRVIEVPIKAGENSGATLPHRNVVREYAMLGPVKGTSQSFALPAAKQAGLRTAVLVADRPGGPIVAAAHD